MTPQRIAIVVGRAGCPALAPTLRSLVAAAAQLGVECRGIQTGDGDDERQVVVLTPSTVDAFISPPLAAPPTVGEYLAALAGPHELFAPAEPLESLAEAMRGMPLEPVSTPAEVEANAAFTLDLAEAATEEALLD